MNANTFGTPTVPHLFEKTKQALNTELISHRSAAFITLFEKTIENLSIFLDAHAYLPLLLSGSGTLANEIMIWNFLTPQTRCVGFGNGEFLNRLTTQISVITPPVAMFKTIEELTLFCQNNERFDFLYTPALETSFGTIAPFKKLNTLAETYGFKILLDAVSGIGIVENLFSYQHVLALSATSGKALAGLPGIAMLFIRRDFSLEERHSIPSFLNIYTLLESYAKRQYARNTLSSHLLNTLSESVVSSCTFSDYTQQRKESHLQIDQVLVDLGFKKVVESQGYLVSRYHYPKGINIDHFHAHLERNGHHLYYQVLYLKASQHLQVATMGNVTPKLTNLLCCALRSR